MFNWFDDLRIGTKLLVVLTVVLAFTVLVGAISIVQLDRLSSDARLLAASALPRARHVAAMRASVLEMRAVRYAHMLSDSEDEQKLLKTRITGFADAVATARANRRFAPSTLGSAQLSPRPDSSAPLGKSGKVKIDFRP